MAPSLPFCRVEARRLQDREPRYQESVFDDAVGWEWCAVPYMPYSTSEQVPSLMVTSDSFQDGERLAPEHGGAPFGVPGGQDLSPQLSWGPLPEGTKSVAVTMFDPDAPIPS